MKNYIIAITSSIITLLMTIPILSLMTKGEAEIIVGDSSVMNPGVIEAYSGATIPDGYLLCDGREVSRTTYAELFKVIGTTYGSGNGSTTFNLPNLTGRTPVGKDENTFASLGDKGGSVNTTLTTSNLPAHTHDVTPKGTVTSTFTGSSATTSSSGNHTHSFRMGDGTGSTASGYEGVVAYNEFDSSGASGNYKLISYPKFKYHKTANQTAGAHTHTLTAKGTVKSTFAGSKVTTTSTGSGQAFTNMQPYIVVNYIIKY